MVTTIQAKVYKDLILTKDSNERITILNIMHWAHTGDASH